MAAPTESPLCSRADEFVSGAPAMCGRQGRRRSASRVYRKERDASMPNPRPVQTDTPPVTIAKGRCYRRHCGRTPDFTRNLANTALAICPTSSLRRFARGRPEPLVLLPPWFCSGGLLREGRSLREGPVVLDPPLPLAARLPRRDPRWVRRDSSMFRPLRAPGWIISLVSGTKVAVRLRNLNVNCGRLPVSRPTMPITVEQRGSQCIHVEGLITKGVGLIAQLMQPKLRFV